MELMDTILKRRSIRRYTGEDIPEETLQKILQAGLLAPTSRNLKPWEFYVVRDRETLRKLSMVKNAGGGMLAECSAAIAVFGDSERADTWVEDCSIAMSFMMLMAAEQGVGSCWARQDSGSPASWPWASRRKKRERTLCRTRIGERSTGSRQGGRKSSTVRQGRRHSMAEIRPQRRACLLKNRIRRQRK